MKEQFQRFSCNIQMALDRSEFLRNVTYIACLGFVGLLLGVILGVFLVHWKIGISLISIAYIVRLIYAGFTGK